MKKNIKFILAIILVLTLMTSCQKENRIYVENVYLNQQFDKADSVQLKTCKYGLLTFPNPSLQSYNAVMKASFTLNPNVLIKTEPLEWFDCNTNINK